MSTQKPTRNNCKQKRNIWEKLARYGCESDQRRAACLLPGFDHLPPIHPGLIVSVQQGQAAREGRRLLVENGLASGQQQRQADERNTDRVQGNCKPCKVDDAVVLNAVAIESVVHLQKPSAIVKHLTIKGLEGAGGNHREGKERETEQIWHGMNQAGLQAGRLAFGDNLGGHAASKDEQSEHVGHQHQEEQLVEK